MGADYPCAAIDDLWYLIECGFLRGTDEDNNYGPDPLARYQCVVRTLLLPMRWLFEPVSRDQRSRDS